MPANVRPAVIPIIGTVPLIRASMSYVGVHWPAAEMSEKSVSPERPPAPSAQMISGVACSSANLIIRSVFWCPIIPCVPAQTVSSYIATSVVARSSAKSSPLTVPIPVIIPSAGARTRISSSDMIRCRAGSTSAPNSTQVPGSTSSARLSRCVRLPFA